MEEIKSGGDQKCQASLLLKPDPGRVAVFCAAKHGWSTFTPRPATRTVVWLCFATPNTAGQGLRIHEPLARNRAHCQGRRPALKRHHAAVRALAFKRNRILFRCWKTANPTTKPATLSNSAPKASPTSPARKLLDPIPQLSFPPDAALDAALFLGIMASERLPLRAKDFDSCLFVDCTCTTLVKCQESSAVVEDAAARIT